MMKRFEEFSLEVTKARENYIIAEWIAAFETVLDLMCQEVTKRAETMTKALELQETEIHLLNYTDREYVDGYDEFCNIFAYTTSTLPTIETKTAEEVLAKQLTEKLHEAGWTHLEVSLESFETGNHLIAHPAYMMIQATV